MLLMRLNISFLDSFSQIDLSFVYIYTFNVHSAVIEICNGKRSFPRITGGYFFCNRFLGLPPKPRLGIDKQYYYDKLQQYPIRSSDYLTGLRHIHRLLCLNPYTIHIECFQSLIFSNALMFICIFSSICCHGNT